MRRTRVAFLGIGAACAAVAARACFPGAPWELLTDRQATLQAPPVNSFAWEVVRLVPAPADGPKPVEALDQPPADQRQAAEKSDLDAQQFAMVGAMRQSMDAQVAFETGDSLPDAVRAYTAGAVAFNKGAWAQAAPYFRAVLAMPPAQSATRAVWAQFMLGRTLAKLGQVDQAEAAFAQTRAMVAKGAPDSLGLADASLGETALLQLHAGDTAGAVRNYATQAALGSDSGTQSLRMVAESLVRHPETLPKALTDPLTQRLVVDYALGLSGNYLAAPHLGSGRADMTFDTSSPPDAVGEDTPKALFAAVIGAHAPVAQADRLAALAYRVGDFKAAQTLADQAQSPLSVWVRAKLALRSAKDPKVAPALFAQALRLARGGAAGTSLEPTSIDLLQGENSVFLLSRGDFKQAMAVLWPVASLYWGDTAYLAERVLTTDELKAFVDAQVPPGPAKAHDFYNTDPVFGVRALLARRLMRDGRYDEALRYFDAGTADSPSLAPKAAAYAQELQRARGAFWASDRANAAWRAALLMRESGMELSGTEESPDQASVGGQLADWLGPGQDGPFTKTNAAWATQDEHVRYGASAARPDLRWHYRYVAADLAAEAADNLPARSQAYAAVLCTAASWMESSHAQDRARALYRRYVATGAVVSFAKHFGRDCPAPDFAKAKAAQRKYQIARTRDFVHTHKAALGVGGLAGLAAIGSLAWVRRRK